MKFKVDTLLDITETNYRRGNSLESKQQQNFLTFLQVLGLRVNPLYSASPYSEMIMIDNYGFGKKFKNKQRVWTFEFEIEYGGGLTIDMLQDDFNYIPMIDSLDETINLSKSCFETKCNNYTNILFEFA